MRADNNWEDSVGKRLFDLEGDLSPQAWENISRRIAQKPKRRPFWYWLLPALLLFIAIPLTIFRHELFTGNAGKLAGKMVLKTTEKPDVVAKENPQTALSPAETNTGTPEKDPAASEKGTAPEKIVFAEANPGTNEPESHTKTESEKPVIAATRPTKTNIHVLAGIGKHDEEKPAKSPEENATLSAKKPVMKGITYAAASTKKTVKNGMARSGKTAGGSVTVNPENSIRENASTVAASKKGQSGNAKEIARKTQAGAGGKDGVKKANNQADPNLLAGIPTETGLATEKDLAEGNTATAAGNGIAKSGKTASAGGAETTHAADSAAKKETPAIALAAQQDSAQKQPEPEKPKVLKTGSWKIYAAPQYTFQRVFANPHDEVMILGMMNKNSFESERVGYEIGFRKYFQLSDRVQLETGLQFARVNHHIRFRMASTTADSVTVTSQNGQITMEVRNREQNEVLLFKYFFGGLYTGANLSLGHGWKINGGLGANLLLWKNPNEDEAPIPTRSLNPYLNAGITYQISLNQNTYLQAGPTLQYYLSPVQKETAHYQAKPTVVGFSVGLIFNTAK